MCCFPVLQPAVHHLLLGAMMIHLQRLTRFAALVLSFAVLPSGTFLLPDVLQAQQPQWVVELEGGPAWQSYNDLEIPNDGTATRFSLFDLAGSGPWPTGRVQVTWNPRERHGFRVLLAPFSLTETGQPEEAVQFAGGVFQPGVPTRATYTFNSWRLGYRYLARTGQRTTAWIGFTAKVRDAVIRLEQGETTSEKDDLGFVPLLHLAGQWRLAPRWRLDFDADALAGGPGRAADVTVRIGYELGDRWSVRAGYRTIEGGADVSEVYTFAWLHQAVLSVAWRR